MSEIAVRMAREDEIEKARSILGAAYAQYESSFPKENWDPYLADILDLEGRASQSELLIAERDGEIVGCVSYFRWYNDYRLPESYGAGTITVRLHGNEDDVVRRFNRTENIRPIPSTDPDFAKLYSRRNDCESINRGLDDSMWLGRAHGVGHARQHVNLLGYALMVNSVALHEYRKRRPAGLAPAA